MVSVYHAIDGLQLGGIKPLWEIVSHSDNGTRYKGFPEGNQNGRAHGDCREQGGRNQIRKGLGQRTWHKNVGVDTGALTSRRKVGGHAVL